MADVPLPHPVANILIGDDWEDVVTLEQMHAYAAAVSAAKDAEIAALRADFTALQRAIVGDTGASAILEAGRLRAEVAGLREDAERYRWLRSPNTGPATIWELVSDECNPPYMTLKYGANLDTAIDAALAARKGEA